MVSKNPAVYPAVYKGAPLTALFICSTLPLLYPATASAADEKALMKSTKFDDKGSVSADTGITSADKFGASPVQLAVQDLAQRLQIDKTQIEVLEVRKVIWPDASLGCPEPGVMYAQMQVEGQLIRLRARGHMYFYHKGGTQSPLLCQQTAQLLRRTTPKVDEFVPPPDSDID